MEYIIKGIRLNGYDPDDLTCCSGTISVFKHTTESRIDAEEWILANENKCHQFVVHEKTDDGRHVDYMITMSDCKWVEIEGDYPPDLFSIICGS